MSQSLFDALIFLMLQLPLQPLFLQTIATVVVLAVVFSVHYCFHLPLLTCSSPACCQLSLFYSLDFLTWLFACCCRRLLREQCQKGQTSLI